MISVIVPVYKVEPYLRRCVDSILSQTYCDFELILVDDGSPDSCPSICDDYAAQDSRVHVIHQENGGLSAARNAGIDWAFANSDSQWLTFVDSDDCISPAYLEKLYAALAETHADISICGHVSFSGEDSPDYTNNFSRNILLDRRQACRMIYEFKPNHASFVTTWGKLYKKNLFQRIRFPIGRIHEDQFTTYKVFYAANRIVEIGDCLYGYFTNESGIMHSRFALKRYDELVALDEAAAFFRDHDEESLALAAQERKEILWARYSLLARKEGIQAQVPRQYRLSIRGADEILTRKFGSDYSEYFINQFSPAYVKIKAYLRKLRQCLQR